MYKKKIAMKLVKEIFRSYDCSTYVMARNNQKEYESYKELNVPKKTELEWKSEMIEEYSKTISKKTSKGDKWKLINKMCELVESTRYTKNLDLIYETIKNEISNFDAKERVIISETINGRKHISQRSGLIFLSYDIGQTNLAKRYGELSLELLNVKNSDEALDNRIKNSRDLRDEIINELFG